VLGCVRATDLFPRLYVKNANPLSFRTSSFICWLGCGLACVASLYAEKKPANRPFKTVSDYFAVSVGDKTVRMQFAVNMPEMQKGLMGRKSLEPDEGMLFVYPKPQSMSFWMHNTPLPLHIGFFDENGVLREYYALYPFDENTVKSRGTNLQFALEVRQGWFLENKVFAGARIDLTAIAAALEARGFDPEKYGLKKANLAR